MLSNFYVMLSLITSDSNSIIPQLPQHIVILLDEQDNFL